MSILDKITDQVSFLFQDAGDQIWQLQGKDMSAMVVDTIDSETHNFESDVTSFPREGLEEITDNIQQKPVTLSFDCFVSNAPIRGLIDGVVNLADHALNGGKRTQKVYTILYEMWQTKQLFTLTTKYKVYENMAITSITPKQTPDIGDAIVFTINLKRVNIVSSATAKVPAGMGITGDQIGTANQKAGAGVNAGQNANGKGGVIQDIVDGKTNPSQIYNKLKGGANKSVAASIADKVGG